MNPENRWVRKSATIPWHAIEEKYAGLFLSETGMPAKPLRMVLGSLMIQKQYGYMYENNVHTVPNRIVSISQPSDVLIGAIERYRGRTGYYLGRALVDKLYRNRENLTFCRLHDIRLSRPSLDRPKKDAVIDKKREYADNADRVEVERSFSLTKRCYGLGKIMIKLDVTTRSFIVCPSW